MRISEISIKNFRLLKDSAITFSDYTCLIGANGAGKSTVLTALRIFFRDTADTVTDLQTLSEEDFYNKDTTQEIVISVTFEELSAEAQEALQHYYRHGKLVVSAIARWDPATRRADVIQYGERLGLPEFAPFFEADGLGRNATELKAIFEGLRSKHIDLSTAKTKPQMIEALREYEATHSSQLQPIRSSDQFYGFTKGESLLKKYVQWVFIPAVKDASTENLEGKKNALKALLDRTVRAKVSFDDAIRDIRADAQEKFRSALQAQQQALKTLSDSLTSRISRLAHADASIKLLWDETAEKYVNVEEPLARVLGKEGDFEGDLTRFGHGFQRSYLLALLQELSGCLDSGEPKLILACEEPELHQHPPQARHLAAILELISQRNAQIIVCSHSPHFVRGQNFGDVRLVRYDRRRGAADIRSASLEDVSRLIGEALGDTPLAASALGMKIEQTLQDRLKEMFFSPALVLVEGLEDVGYLESYFELLGIRGLLHANGCHVVPTAGKDCMIRPLAIAKLLKIPTFIVFDADGDDQENVDQHKRYNTAILKLCDEVNPDPFPKEVKRASSLCVWPNNIRDTVRSEVGAAEWDKIVSDLAHQRGANVGFFKKNHIFFGQVLSLAWESNRKSPALHDLCAAIMAFSTRHRAAAEGGR